MKFLPLIKVYWQHILVTFTITTGIFWAIYFTFYLPKANLPTNTTTQTAQNAESEGKQEEPIVIPPTPETYSKTKVLTLKYGDGEKEIATKTRQYTNIIGTYKEEVVEVYDGLSYSISSDGNIYLLDGLTGTVYIYDKNGIYKNSFVIDEGNEKEIDQGLPYGHSEKKYALRSILVDKDDIYIYKLVNIQNVEDYKQTQGIILHYTTAGKYIETIDIPDEIEFGSIAGGPRTYFVAGAPLKMSKKGNLMITGCTQAYTSYNVSVNNVEEPQGFFENREEEYYEFFMMGCSAFWEFSNVCPNGLSTQWCNCMGMVNGFEDSKGNFYNWTIKETSSEPHILIQSGVVKINKEQEVLAYIDLLELSDTTGNIDNPRATENGEVYVMVKEDDGKSLYRYTVNN